MTGLENALLHGDELLANDVALLLGIANAFQRREELLLRILDVPRCRADVVEQAGDIGRLTRTHQARVDIGSVHALWSEGAQAQREGNGGIDAAAHEEKYIAIAHCAPDLLFDRRDAIFGIPIARTPADIEHEIGENAAALASVRDLRMELDRDNGAFAVTHGGDVNGF